MITVRNPLCSRLILPCSNYHKNNLLHIIY
nr:MAG TPA: hypothetical protein [Caudoviricetes sp.]